MSLYLKLSRLAFQRQMSYRAATLAGLATNFFFGLLRAAIMIALFQNRNVVAGFDLPKAITFTAVSQAVIGYLSLFSWYDLMQTVYTGEIATDLLKPMGYFRYWLAKDLGRAAASLLTRGVFILLAYSLVFDLVYPKGVIGWLSTLIAVILSWLVSFAWRFLVNLAAFWSPNALGFGRMFFLISYVLSGFVMPLAFFPDWFQQIAMLTPFPHTVNTLIEVFLGLLTPPEIWRAFGVQVFWAIALIAAGQIALRAGVRKLVVQGG